MQVRILQLDGNIPMASREKCHHARMYPSITYMNIVPTYLQVAGPFEKDDGLTEGRHRNALDTDHDIARFVCVPPVEFQPC
jgi:hypothetical protein